MASLDGPDDGSSKGNGHEAIQKLDKQNSFDSPCKCRESIPIKDLQMKDIPCKEEHREVVLTWIRINAFLTLRIRCFMVSPERPDSIDGGSYSCAEAKGKKAPRFGTGYVSHVTMDGKGSDGSESVKITIVTARHVVYNEEEIDGMEVDFSTDGKDENKETIILSKSDQCQYSIVSTGKGDWCEVTFHASIASDNDLKLYKELKQYLQEKNRLECEGIENLGINSLVVIISHPHGRIKKVAFGDIVPNDNGGNASFEDIEFHPDKTFTLFPQSIVTISPGTVINMHGGHEFNLPSEVSVPENRTYRLPNHPCVLETKERLRVRPVQKLTIEQNEEFCCPLHSRFIFLEATSFSCTYTGTANRQAKTENISFPEGTEITFKSKFCLTNNRHYPHLFQLKNSLRFDEVSIIKKVLHDAPTCGGCSGAKVLFVTGGLTSGFVHSVINTDSDKQGYPHIGESGSGFVFKMRSQESKEQLYRNLDG